jgi:hypothetical protein
VLRDKRTDWGRLGVRLGVKYLPFSNYYTYFDSSFRSYYHPTFTFIIFLLVTPSSVLAGYQVQK